MSTQHVLHLPILKKASGTHEREQLVEPGVPSHTGAYCNVRDRGPTQLRVPPQRWTLFTNILPEDREEIVRAARKCYFRRGQTIQMEGDPVRQLVLLTSGCAKLIQFGQNGSEVILKLCGPGEFVGTLELASQGLHCATAQALQPCEGLAWQLRTFDLLALRFPELRTNTAAILAGQLRDLEVRFREITTERVSSRLRSLIVRLMNQVGYRENGAVEIRISREELAQLIGTSLYTVSRLLSEWDKKGIVKARREAVSVRNFRALELLPQEVY